MVPMCVYVSVLRGHIPGEQSVVTNGGLSDKLNFSDFKEFTIYLEGI